jgi:CDP-glucose 4,6-dehydratase
MRRGKLGAMNRFRSLANERILVTGHTGFKGTWLCKFLEILGAETFGYSLEPTKESLHRMMKHPNVTHGMIGDINDKDKFASFVEAVNPSIVFHLAAQPLVRQSYQTPIETFHTNVLGSTHVLDSALKSKNIKGLVAITTDKVYENKELGAAFVEGDPKGGHDPYSASKAAMEMAIDAWRYFYDRKNVKIVSARAGNVIGTGDRSTDRLLPDIINALMSKRNVMLRNPMSIRPWQHVLEPLSGYLLIAERMLLNQNLSFAYNFGPSQESHISVLEVAEKAIEFWKSESQVLIEETKEINYLPEAGKLVLNSELAKKELKWSSTFDASEAIKMTIDGEIDLQYNPADEVIEKQIRNYLEI